MYLAAFCGASVTVCHDVIVSTQSHKNEGLDVIVSIQSHKIEKISLDFVSIQLQ
jgi:uncharacterized protein (UPF0212 family)